jgi:hypothetical protein
MVAATPTPAISPGTGPGTEATVAPELSPVVPVEPSDVSPELVVPPLLPPVLPPLLPPVEPVLVFDPPLPVLLVTKLGM